MDIASHPPEVREAQIVSLDKIRARRLPIPYVAPADPRPRQVVHPSQEKIAAAADLWLADRVFGIAQELVGRLQRTNQPLLPNERARLMRASAALLSQPEGP